MEVVVDETNPKHFEFRVSQLRKGGYFMKGRIEMIKEKGIVHYKALFLKKST